MYIRFHVTYPLLYQILMKFNFLDRLSKNNQISNFMKIHPVGTELLHADGRKNGRTDRQTDRQTDMIKLIVAFRNFAKAPKKKTCHHTYIIRIIYRHGVILL